MTKRKLPTPARQDQPRAILASLAAWLAAAPGRRVTLEHGPDGWRSTLHEARSCGGVSLVDAASQSAQVATLETAS